MSNTVYGRRKMDAPTVAVSGNTSGEPTRPAVRQRVTLSPMLDPVRIRFRTDGPFEAEDARWRRDGSELRWMRDDEPNDTPPAEPGDIWPTHWHDNDAANKQGPLAGYAICCPKCGEVHHWTTATNCEPKIPYTVVGTDGVEYHGVKCQHSGVGSCWNWTGSAEEGTLSATPSLYCVEGLGGCGWHGHLTNGVLKHC